MTGDERKFLVEAVRSRMQEPSNYEQLAEECCELAHAALKLARFMRGVNPTDKSGVDIYQNVVEEFGDVLLTAEILKLEPDNEIIESKLMRWNDRLDRIRDRKWHSAIRLTTISTKSYNGDGNTI